MLYNYKVRRMKMSVNQNELTLEIGDTRFFVRIDEESNVKKGVSAHAHTHFFSEIHYFSEGGATVYTGEKIFLSNSDFLLVAPHCYHGTDDATDNALRWCVSIELHQVEKSSKTERTYAYFSEIFSKRKSVVLRNQKKLSARLSIILKQLKKTDPLSKFKLKNLFSLWILDFCEAVCKKQKISATPFFSYSKEKEEEDRLIFKLDGMIGSSFSSLTLQKLSNDLFIGKKQIEAIVKKRYGVTFKQAIIALRIENIKKQLVETDEPIKKIVQKYGYTNLTSFYVAFKKHVGLSPNEYRKQNGK